MSRYVLLAVLALGCVEPTEAVVNRVETVTLTGQSCGTGVGPSMNGSGGMAVVTVCVDVPERRRIAVAEGGMVCVLDRVERPRSGQRMLCNWREREYLDFWPEDVP